MKNSNRLTKSHIIKTAQHSLGHSLQKMRHLRGFDLETVTQQTHISTHDIDLLEIGKSRRLAHIFKLALFYDCKVKIILTQADSRSKKQH